MFRAGSICVLILLLGTVLCGADSITVDGKRYDNVRIRESGTRYYVTVPSEKRSFSVSKDRLAPGDVERSDAEPVSPPIKESPEGPAAAVPLPVGAPEGNALEAGASTVFVPAEQPNGKPLEINALVLKAGANSLAFCAVDTAALDQQLLKAVSNRLIDERSGIKRFNLMLAATHTYAGAFPGLMKGALQEIAFGDYDGAGFDQAVELIVKAIVQAESALCPARMRVGEAAAPQYVRNRNQEDGIVDAALNALCVESEAGAPLAYLVNFASQPVIPFEARSASERSRDFPGGIAAALRQAAGAAVPVVFINGAEASADPKPPSGDVPAAQAESLGLALGAIVLDALSRAPLLAIDAVDSRTRSVDLPASLLGELAPRTTQLQDFTVGPAVFLSLPGEAGAEIGLALREKAITRGAQHVFLCGLTGDYTGYHSDTDEFFKPFKEARMCFYGPLMIHWYLSNHLPGLEGVPPPPVWRTCPLLGQYKNAYYVGLSKGKEEKDIIFVAWNNVCENIRTMANMIRAAGGLSPEVQQLAAKVSTSDSVNIAIQFAAVFAREQCQDFTDEQRAKLIGVAENARLPVDAIMLLQFLVNPVNVPQEAVQLFAAIQFTGMDFLKD